MDKFGLSWPTIDRNSAPMRSAPPRQRRYDCQQNKKIMIKFLPRIFLLPPGAFPDRAACVESVQM